MPVFQFGAQDSSPPVRFGAWNYTFVSAGSGVSLALQVADRPIVLHGFHMNNSNMGRVQFFDNASGSSNTVYDLDTAFGTDVNPSISNWGADVYLANGLRVTTDGAAAPGTLATNKGVLIAWI